MIAYLSSPYIATVWAYGPTAQNILTHIGLGWGFGIWAIIFPIVCAPLFFLFHYYQKKAEREGIVKKSDGGRTLFQSIMYYGEEFDVIGLLLISAGLTLFLLSFSLYSYQPDQWRSPMIICYYFRGILNHRLCPI